MYLALEWDPKLKKLYYDEDAAEVKVLQVINYYWNIVEPIFCKYLFKKL